MAGVGNSQQSIRKALGVLKDTTTVGLVKVNSDYKDLDIAIVKATNHVEHLVKEKHIKTIFDAVSASRPRADVAYCINALARRLARTRNWAVALKTLIILHRALREVDPTFQEELVKYTKTRGFMMNLSHFKDDSSPSAWDYSAWVRTYALYLEERLECFRVLKYDVETERCRIAEAGTTELLDHLPALQQHLFRLLGCQPEGAATYNYVIRYALSMVAGESIKIYSAINCGTLHLVDKFFEMPRHDAVRAIEIYKKTGSQAERLSEFYEICKGFGIGTEENFAKIEQPPASFVAAMQDYVKELSRAMQNKSVDTLTSSRLSLAIEYNLKDEEDKTSATPEPPAAETVDVPAHSQSTDLPGLGEIDHSAAEIEDKDARAFAIVSHGNPSNGTSDGTTGTSGWEVTLVGHPSSNENAVSQNKLAGGLDKSSNPSGAHLMGVVGPNSLSTPQYPPSNSLAPPANVQTVAMAEQQEC